MIVLEAEDFEVWDTASGNRIATFATADEAVGWVRELSRQQGMVGFADDLVIGAADDSWTLSGDALRERLA